MFEIDRYGRTPIYEQIVVKTSRLILSGVLKPEDQLPSVRSLSEKLSVNPNTLQKAYTELERQGICYSVPGSGRYVSKEAPEILRLRTLGQIGEIETLCRSVFSAGATLEEVHAAVDRAFEKGGSL